MVPVALDRFLLETYDVDLRDSALVLLRSALRAREAGDAVLARQRFEAAGALLPAFGDWARLLAADAAGRAGDVATTERLLAASDPELARDRGWRARVRAHRQANDIAGAAVAAAQAQPAPLSERVDAWVMRGELQLLLRDSAAARAAFRVAADSFPSATRTVDAARTLGGMSGLTLEDRARIGRVYLRHGNMPRALSNLDAYLDGRGGTPDTRNALRLEIGRALVARGENDMAEQRMLRLAALQIAPELAAEALLIAGRAQYRQGEETQGRATLERAVERMQGTGAIAANALFVLGDMAHDDGRIDAARTYYRRAGAAAPASARGHEAAVRYAALAYLGGDMKAAASAFSATPGDGVRRQRLDYWAARAHRAAGDSSIAASLLNAVIVANPLSYYGMRAAERLGAPTPTVPPGAEDGEQTHTRVQNALLRYDLLGALGLSDAASYE
ncbi:MAG: tetratricopeptide repeat protein, partial [Longimicrobiales bacterium]